MVVFSELFVINFATPRLSALCWLPGLIQILLPLFTPGIPQRLVRVVWGAAGCPWLVRWANKLVKVY